LEAVLPEDKQSVFLKCGVTVSKEYIDSGQGQKKEDCINMKLHILYGGCYWFTI